MCGPTLTDSKNQLQLKRFGILVANMQMLSVKPSESRKKEIVKGNVRVLIQRTILKRPGVLYVEEGSNDKPRLSRKEVCQQTFSIESGVYTNR